MLQIETDLVKNFRAYLEYWGKLIEYKAGAFVTYFEKVCWVLTKKGLEAAMPVLT